MRRTMVTMMLVLNALTIAAPVSAKPWNVVIDKPSRFKVLSAFRGEAVLDKETGLVWTRRPGVGASTACEIDQVPWGTAHGCCNLTVIANRAGWRLPTAAELQTLLDVTQPAPSLPPGHPFANVTVTDGYGYWTVTEVAGNPAYAWFVRFANGDSATSPKNSGRSTWCVRAPSTSALD